MILNFSQFSVAEIVENNKEDLSDTTKTKVNTNKIVGFLYTTTNGEGENEIVQLARHEDGTVSSPENSTV